jgi:hypothetical protein
MKSRLFIFIFIFLLSAFSVSAQAENSHNDKPAQKEDVPKNIKESLAKQRIAQEKKKYDELIKRGEEAAQLGEELEKSFNENKQFTADDRKKLDRLEKIVKRIRSDMGGSGGDGEIELDEDRPLSILSAIELLKTNTFKLVDELKKLNRFSISAMAIQSSNNLLNVMRFLRTGRN